MTKTITKAGVIKALKTEKLKRRAYFHGVSSYDTPPPEGCAVCAVGAVLRHMSFEAWARKHKFNMSDLGNQATHCQGGDPRPFFKDKIAAALQDKKYLSALSMFFESGKTREKCIRFVRDKFPARLKVRIDA